ncbi:MAG: 50S ribosomal protein L23 [Anaerolineae bacterium]|nr:50S ribosomal protein L23 [Anaerolineae bacterium]MDW8101534.1 50S ribosomal protein L23 [Anaerolineae bacterium]
MHLYEIIRRPIDTEKTRILAEQGQYVFEVDPRANKIQVKQAVEKIYNVKVEEVRIINLPAKKARRGYRIVVRKPARKKAVVKLAPGEKIQIFEGV